MQSKKCIDYISGINLQKCANFVIDFDHPYLDPKILKSNAIIFCKTDFIYDLFSFICFSQHKYILLTHMSDFPIDFYRFSKKPTNIVRWFAQNVVFNHKDLISIPLGLENQSGKSKGKFTNHDLFISQLEYFKEKDKVKDIVYCNWSKDSNQENRKGIIEKLQVPFIWEEKLSFETYCDNASHYKFIICPPGNGVDTHRVWESLYMNCIPIALKHHIYQEYKLPIIQVNKWEDVTPELLERHKEAKVNEEELKNEYWCNKIKEEFKKL